MFESHRKYMEQFLAIIINHFNLSNIESIFVWIPGIKPIVGNTWFRHVLYVKESILLKKEAYEFDENIPSTEIKYNESLFLSIEFIRPLDKFHFVYLPYQTSLSTSTDQVTLRILFPSVVHDDIETYFVALNKALSALKMEKAK